MDKLLFKRILVAALTVLALVYVAYLLISANFDSYPTENAVMATVSDKIKTNGMIIRDETVLSNTSSGVLSYTVSNGEAVNANGEIAKVFSNESDAVAQTTADQLRARKESLEYIQKNTISGTMSLDVINNNVRSKMIALLDDVNNVKISSAKSDCDQLMIPINQRLLYTGKVDNFGKEIAQLQSQIDALSASSNAISNLTTPKAGYFCRFCDGYESSFDYGNIKYMTLSDLRNAKKADVPSNNAGKIISNVKWYVACEVTGEEALSLKIYDGDVSVMLSEASTEAIPAEVTRITSADSQDKALVVLMCDYMNDGLMQARTEPVEICMGTYTGLRISKRAIHDDYVTKVTYDDNDNPHKEQKKVQGVYVLYGSEVQFKQISILYSEKDHVICDTSPAKGVLFNGKTVELYDKVIVKGDDLYDGKVIK